MDNANDVIAQLVTDIMDKQKMLDAIGHLNSIYTDLLIYRPPELVSGYHLIKFSSARANAITEDIDIEINSGIVEALPYTTYDGYKVYSNPISFIIGTTNNSGFGINPRLGWDDDMADASISKAAIKKTKLYLTKNRPIKY